MRQDEVTQGDNIDYKSRGQNRIQGYMNIWKLDKGGGLAGDKGENQEGENNKMWMCWAVIGEGKEVTAAMANYW